MQKKILISPKVPPSILDQASTWLEEMRNRLNLRIKTKRSVHPRTLVAFVNETLSAVIQSVQPAPNEGFRHHLGSDLGLSEFLIKVKRSKKKDKPTRIVTGANGAQMKPTTYDEYINASKGKVQKGKGKGTDGKGTTKNWRQPCSDYWEPDGCNLGHNCLKYHPR